MNALMRLQKHAVLATALFFALLTLAGLLTCGDYGLPSDEPAEQTILQQNLMEYAVRLLGENSDAARYYNGLGITRISQSIERDHGESAYYLAAPILQLASAQPDTMTTLWHAYTWLWFMAGVYALYLLMRELGLSRALACATALLLYLSPRFFAEGHYNNKDILLLSLTLCTLAAGVRFLREPTIRRALFFSLAGALAANTKIVGALSWGLILLATLISLVARKRLNRSRLVAGLTAVGAFALFYAALTPALWAGPIAFVRYLLSNAVGFSRWSGVVYFQGVFFNPTRGVLLPRAYLPEMIALTTPVPFLLLAIAGQLRAVALCIRRDSRRPAFVVLTLLWLLPVAYVVLARPLLYNGWRHFYFLYAAVIAMGGLGLQWFWEALGSGRARKTVGAGAIAMLFLWQAVGIALNHPYQYVYYNALARDVSQRYELDYWDVSTLNAMRRLCESGERDESLPLTLSARDDMSAFGVEHGYTVLSAAQRSQLTISTDTEANYLFYNATYAKIYGVEPPQGYRELFTLYAYGNALCTVYERQSPTV
jgi:hypothetical protein